MYSGRSGFIDISKDCHVTLSTFFPLVFPCGMEKTATRGLIPESCIKPANPIEAGHFWLQSDFYVVF